MSFSRQISLAPMLDWTDRHFRYFIRLLNSQIVLYTEMITTGAILHGDADRHLMFNKEEHPLVLQLGGSDPAALVQCALIGEDYGYDEINLNVGCPSNRVQSGRFGVCLMKEPIRVAACVRAMQEAVKIPVTVKCRIGVDDCDKFEDLKNFIACLVDAGCAHVIIHARKAWLKGLSPKENRNVPPLCYDYVYRIKQLFPQLYITINGGISNLAEIKLHLQHVDGVMIGREAYQNSFIVLQLALPEGQEQDVVALRVSIIDDYLEYVEQQLQQGVRLSTLIRPILSFFNGVPGAKSWRRYLSQHAVNKSSDCSIIRQSIQFVTIRAEKYC